MDGKIARAREGFKRLFKLQPDVYRERFIEVTKKAIEVAISEGKSTQAKQWLDHLINELGVHPEMLKIESLNLAYLLGDASVQPELVRLQFTSDNEAQRQKGADALVLEQASEAETVCRAITHLCRSEWDEMRESLLEIGRKSPFAHWRLFLRGCAAYYQNDHPLAQACFSKLPKDSLPALKAEAFADWKVKDVSNTSDSTIKQACQLIGEPQMVEPIIKSHNDWVKKKYFQAYESIHSTEATFPDFKINLAGQLTSFFQHAFTSMNYEDFDCWSGTIMSLLSHKRFQTAADQYVLTNSSIHGKDGEFDEVWDTYMENRKKIRGSSPRFNALCSLIRAESVMEFDDDGFDDYINEESEDYLKQAIKHDPSYEPAYTKLLELYQKSDATSKKNKLLDTMSQLFPESPTVLIAAATACLDRKAYVKGLKYLEKARILSPLDRKVSCEMCRGLLAKAVAHYAKKTASQTERGLATFHLLLAEAGGSQNIITSREFYALHGAVLEKLLVNKKVSIENTYRDLAKGMPPHVLEFTTALYRDVYAQTLNNEIIFGDIQLKLKGNKTIAQAISILEILFAQLKNNKIKLRQIWLSWIEKYIDQSLRKITKDERESVIKIYHLLNDTSGYWDEYPDRLVEKWLKIDKKDPLFLVWSIDLNYEYPPKKKIDQIRKEAEKRGDRIALTALENFLTDFEDEDDYYDDCDDDGFMGVLPPASLEEMNSILSKLNPEERVAFLISQGLPSHLAQMLSETLDDFAAKKTSKQSTHSNQKKTTTQAKPKPKPKQKPKPTVDPNQPEFKF